jgi:hypothetical protein
VNGKCEKITCPTGEHYDPEQKNVFLTYQNVRQFRQYQEAAVMIAQYVLKHQRE